MKGLEVVSSVHVTLGFGKDIEDAAFDGIGGPPIRQHMSGDLLYLLLPVIITDLHQLVSTRLPRHVNWNERQILAQHEPWGLFAESSIIGKPLCCIICRDGARSASDRLKVIVGDL